jgi:hypothetical protein
MANGVYTYSFKDLVGVLNFPGFVPFTLSGELGADRLTIEMSTERAAQAVASDGAVMQTYIAGSNGRLSLELQETSPLHAYLINVMNTLTGQADSGNVSNFVAGTAQFTAIVNGYIFLCYGISPTKIADIPFAKDGGNVTWSLLCARIVQQAVNPLG